MEEAKTGEQLVRRRVVMNGGSTGEASGARILPWRGRKEGRYGDAFSRALDRVSRRNPGLDQQKVQAARQARDLLEQPPGRRSLLLGNHPDFGGWWLAAMLADEADGRRRSDPGAAVQLARLATEVARRIETADDPGDGSPEQPLVEDVTARSWRSLADAQRGAGELEAAAVSLARARRHLRRGTREPLERAALLESTARLLAARGRRRARTCFRAAAALYEELGENHRAGRCRLAGLLLLEEPDTGAQRRLQALELRQGLAMLDVGTDPELTTAARRRLAALSGQPDHRASADPAEDGGTACYCPVLQPVPAAGTGSDGTTEKLPANAPGPQPGPCCGLGG